MSKGYPYTADEKNLFACFARQLIDGKYENAGGAARACLQEHERMRSRLAVPPPQRPLNGIQQAITKTAHELGSPPRIDDWTPAELRVVKRCARGVASGRYKRVIDAVRECRAKLAGRHTPHSTHARICRHAAELGWQGVFKMWNKEENQIADRFANAVNSGEYPRCAAATDDCMRALKAAGMPERTRADVFQKLARRTLSLGRKLKYKRWSSKELSVIEPYARRLAAGEYHNSYEAARECRKALDRAGFRSRSVYGVRLPVLRMARALGRQGVHLAWTDREMARIEGVARDYAARKYPNIVAATEVAIHRLRKARIGMPRKYSSVAPKVLARAHELGRPNYWRLWSDAENRRCDVWIRWYEKHRHVRRYRPAQEAVLGLQEELERLGIDRTRGACSNYFYKRRKLLKEHSGEVT